MPTPVQRSAEERRWQDHKTHWLARDVYTVQKTGILLGVVLLPVLIPLALCLGWIVVALTDYLMK